MITLSLFSCFFSVKTMASTDDVVLLYAHPSTSKLAQEIAQCCHDGGSLNESVFSESCDSPNVGMMRVVNEHSPPVASSPPMHVCVMCVPR